MIMIAFDLFILVSLYIKAEVLPKLERWIEEG